GIDDLPEYINLPGTDYQLKKYYRNQFFADETLIKKVFTHPILGDFYLTDDGCLMVELPDHSAIAYDIVIPFIGSEGNGSVDINFNNGGYNDETYTHTRIFGCGAKCI